MLKNTNLEEVKEVFKNLLYAVSIEPQIAAICCHPFTESSIVPKISITNDNIFKIEDSYWDLKKAEDYNEWTKYICKNIDEFKDVSHLSDNYLLQATVKKEDCLCYFNGRDEDEIVVDSRHIKPKRIDYV